MSEDRPVLGIVLAHGEMARGMVDAVGRIAGAAPDAVVAVSNEGRSPEKLEEEIEAMVGDRPAIIFTDLHTGSCALVARLACRKHGDRAVLFGTNLAMLLDFVFHRDLPLRELVPRLLLKGRESVRSLPEALSHADSPVSR